MNCTFTYFLYHLLESSPIPWNLLFIHRNLSLKNVRPRRTLEVIYGKATPSIDFTDLRAGYYGWKRETPTVTARALCIFFLINHPSMLPYLLSQCICSFPTGPANTGRTNTSKVGSSKLNFTPNIEIQRLFTPDFPTLPEKGCFVSFSHPRSNLWENLKVSLRWA